MTNDQQTPQDEPIIQGHNYDGIQEYDNPMPGWWVWIFWLCVIFTPVYILGVHVFGFINTYEDDLAASQAQLQEVRDAYEAANPTFEVSNEAIAAFVGVQEHIDAGAALYGTNCAMCHGDQGQGLIGPNLTDAYWIHGNQNTDLYAVITNGVLDKGMTPWGNILSPDERSQLVAYIRSIEGSEPEGAKEPQGDFYGDDEDDSDDDSGEDAEA